MPLRKTLPTLLALSGCAKHPELIEVVAQGTPCVEVELKTMLVDTVTKKCADLARGCIVKDLELGMPDHVEPLILQYAFQIESVANTPLSPIEETPACFIFPTSPSKVE